jgi:Domain of unknown function (DUF397)
MMYDEVLAVLGTASGWRKPARSQAQNACVEVTTAVPGWVGVRDTKLGSASPLLAVSAGGWGALVESAKEGEFDR